MTIAGKVTLRPEDPLHMHVDAAFAVLGEANNRMALDVLRLEPRTASDLSQHVGYRREGAHKILTELLAAGFVTTVEGKGEPIYVYGGPAVSMVKSWIAQLPG